MPRQDDTSIRSWDAVADDWVSHADENDYRNYLLLPSRLSYSETFAAFGFLILAVARVVTAESSQHVAPESWVLMGVLSLWRSPGGRRCGATDRVSLRKRELP